MARLIILIGRGAGLAAVLLACIALGSARGAAAAADVKIASLDCTSNPEVVELTNSGDESQDLAGWQLQSDPIGSQSYDLTQIGVLAPGSSVFIESGPNAEATFTWSTEDIFRTDDPDDFARLVDSSGSTRSEEACAAVVQPTASTEPTPTIAPAATPTAAPADGVPDGGGPPTGGAASLVNPLTVVVAGGSLAGAGGMALLAMWLSGAVSLLKRREPMVFETPPPPPPPLMRSSSRRAQSSTEPLVLALVVALCAAIVVALVLPAFSHRK